MMAAALDTTTTTSPQQEQQQPQQQQQKQLATDDDDDDDDDENDEEIDDWGLEGDFHVFAQHEPQSVYLSPEHSFSILCVEALTPIDMANLGSGIHDATGHCVWTGAFVLIRALDRLTESCFAGRRILELGAGTGIGGIALACSQQCQVSHLTFTDADPDALDLCERNCRLNQLAPTLYEIRALTWGSESINNQNYYDTILATDVLYDIGLLPPLFTTARNHLGHDDGGIFVLAHVPRACYNTAHPPVDNLETHIVDRAREFGFGLQQILRPSDLRTWDTASLPRDALNRVSLPELQEIGAAVLVFHTLSSYV